MSFSLPIDDIIDDLISEVRNRRRAVLQAPPGAGKTTRVPLALMQAAVTTGKIIMLEPRRLAARAAAERMAESLGEPVGQTVGYRIRGESRVSGATKIEVVTEGILTRMLQSTPDLPGTGAVIFDEFHERSLNADLGLALCLEVVSALRDDLILIAMSATLDTEPVAALMEARVVQSQGRSFPVETIWLDRPLGPQAHRVNALCDLVVRAERETRQSGGGILVFLPGEREIRSAESRLKKELPETCSIRPLFGAMPFTSQRAAIAPVKHGRKVVLATSIAETSLTIEDIMVVVDAGLARRARFDPGSGMSRLLTERVTRAEAEQRRGRAGRVAKGQCFRLWTRGEEGALAAHPPAEIEAADLTGLALELAQWGAAAGDLPFLTQPPDGTMAEAQALLRMLGAVDARGQITKHGQKLTTFPLHPRLAHMLVEAGAQAALLAALMAERDPLSGAPCDLLLRLEAIKNPKTFADTRSYDVNRGVIDRIRTEQKRLRSGVSGAGQTLSPASMAALAYPDRIGQRRKGEAPRYVLSGGKGAVLGDTDTLAAAPYIVAIDTDGNPREARVRMGAQISETEIRDLFADQIDWHDVCQWSRRDRRVITRREERFGSLILDDRVWKDVPAETVATAMLEGVRELGLGLNGPSRRFAARVELARSSGMDMPDMSETALMENIQDWLLPMLSGVRTAEDWKRFDPLPALRGMLSWEQQKTLDIQVPGSFVTPLDRKVSIDYSDEGPEIAVRLQELFGVTEHPLVGGVPLKITLLSPAHRPVQVTRDLPGFWSGSYADVRKDMRAAYPKHPWPEDPTKADPTLKAKRRK